MGFHGGLVHGTNRGAQYREIVKWYVEKSSLFRWQVSHDRQYPR